MADDEIQGLSVKVNITDDLYTQGVGKINASMKMLQSEFKASSEELKLFGNDAQQLGAKSEYLNNAIELQRQKVQALQEAYEKSKTESGEFANSTMNAGTKVNNAVAQLAKMQGELKSVDSELEKTREEESKLSASEGLNKLGSSVEGAKGKILSLKTAFATITATLAGGFGLVKFTEGAIEAGDNSYKLSQKLHLTTAETASLNKIFSVTGTDSSAFASTMTKLDKSILGAGESGNSTTKMLEKYGVSLTDANGKLLPMNEQLDALAAAYQKSADAGEEDAFSAEVLGNKGAALIPLLENYTDAKEEAAKVKGIGVDPEEAHQTEEELKVLKMQVSATGGVIAKALIPVVQEILPPLIELFQNVATKVKENKDELDKFIQSAIQIGKELAEEIAPAVKDVLNFIANNGEASKDIIIGVIGAFAGIEGIIKSVNGVKTAMDTWKNIKSIGDDISKVIEKFALWTAATETQTVAQEELDVAEDANPIGAIILGITALVAGIVWLYNNCETFRDGVNEIGAWLANFFTVTLPQAFNTVVTFFQDNWKEILLFIVNPFAGAFALLYNNCDGFREKVNTFITAVKTAFINGWNAIVNFFTITIPQWINNLGQWFAELPNKIMYGLGSLVGMLATWGVEVWNYFSTNVPIWINNVTTFFSQLPTNIWNFLADIVAKIGQWGSDVLNYVTTNVPIWINNTVNFFAQLPSEIWNWLANVVTNLGTWGSNVISWISTNVSTWITNIVNYFTQLPSQIGTWLTNVVTDLGTWGSNMYNAAQTEVSTVVDGIIQWFSDLPNKMIDIGSNIVAGIKQGISNGWDNLKSWVGGLCDSFVQGVKDKFEIHSPSHIFRDQIGAMLAQGIDVGFENEMPTINTNIGKTIDGTIQIANLSSLSSLKNIDKTYSSNNSKDSQPIVLYTTNVNQVDSKEVSRTTTKQVLNNLNRESKNNNISLGRSNLAYDV